MPIDVNLQTTDPYAISGSLFTGGPSGTFVCLNLSTKTGQDHAGTVHIYTKDPTDLFVLAEEAKRLGLSLAAQLAGEESVRREISRIEQDAEVETEYAVTGNPIA